MESSRTWHDSSSFNDTSKLDKESAKLQSKTEVVTGMLHKCVEGNAHSTIDQAEYEERYKVLADRYEDIKKGLIEIDEKRLERSANHESIAAFMRELEHTEGMVAEFNEELWNSTIEKVVVHSEHEITFIFKDGMELEWNI